MIHFGLPRHKDLAVDHHRRTQLVEEVGRAVSFVVVEVPYGLGKVLVHRVPWFQAEASYPLSCLPKTKQVLTLHDQAPNTYDSSL